MQLFLGAVPIILRLFSKARGHLLFSNYSRNNLPKPTYGCTWQDITLIWAWLYDIVVIVLRTKS